jgi:hypothetical protein
MSAAPYTLKDMASDYTVRQKQQALQQLREKLHRESAKIGPAHAKASKARADAAKAKAESTRRSKLAEAEREDKKAATAENERAKIERQIATKEKELVEATRKFNAEVAKEQKRAMDRLNQTIAVQEARFRPDSPLGGGRVIPASPVLGSGLSEAPVWDVFISHASEDKEDIARPLARALEARGISVWFDELTIGWGTPIHRAIEEGIARATFGLVILSPHFMFKKWTKAELDGLYGRQMDQPDGYGTIKPIWHRVTYDDVARELPMIASLKAMSTAVFSVEQIADEVLKLVQASRL